MLFRFKHVFTMPQMTNMGRMRAMAYLQARWMMAKLARQEGLLNPPYHASRRRLRRWRNSWLAPTNQQTDLVKGGEGQPDWLAISFLFWQAAEPNKTFPHINLLGVLMFQTHFIELFLNGFSNNNDFANHEQKTKMIFKKFISVDTPFSRWFRLVTSIFFALEAGLWLCWAYESL